MHLKSSPANLLSILLLTTTLSTPALTDDLPCTKIPNTQPYQNQLYFESRDEGKNIFLRVLRKDCTDNKSIDAIHRENGSLKPDDITTKVDGQDVHFHWVDGWRWTLPPTVRVNNGAEQNTQSCQLGHDNIQRCYVPF
ncbi:hypothetical protein HYALB_00011622 [Hymenoscyphus albidus]|uniref:Uncharacterized protein n=1 Tax=Hymenoscyphus albidus TaxID=595503 RepID=A0A9N9PZP6_9HELO|nr:hypothetical protein HYALB_00011622 [Hymenoscyphus albidus]